MFYRVRNRILILQLEVLEMLVQNGADLNARTKHDETPAGIAFDDNFFLSFFFFCSAILNAFHLLFELRMLLNLTLVNVSCPKKFISVLITLHFHPKHINTLQKRGYFSVDSAKKIS